MKRHRNDTAETITFENPLSVLEEIKIIVLKIYPNFDFRTIDLVFSDIVKLFNGEFPGYQKCNTEYHDFRHTTDATLAMARLMCGGYSSGIRFTEENFTLGIIAALLHDTGYIQSKEDVKGTGAKYTLTHIDRSIHFMETYFNNRNYTEKNIKDCADLLKCTGLNVDISSIKFSSKETEILGKMLGTADLIGQMADRLYLEKLLFLYHEFKEGHVAGYESELDLLSKSLSFYETTKTRLSKVLDSVTKYLPAYFKEYYNTPKDLYKEAIEKNMQYLKHVLDVQKKGYRSFLRRGGIVKKLIQRNL